MGHPIWKADDEGLSALLSAVFGEWSSRGPDHQALRLVLEEFGPGDSSLWKLVAPKLRQSMNDGQLHSRGLVAPLEGVCLLILVLTERSPRPAEELLSESLHAQLDLQRKRASVLLGGVLVLQVTASGSESADEVPVSVAAAYRPFQEQLELLPNSLRKALVPRSPRVKPPQIEPPPLPPPGREEVEVLAAAVSNVEAALERLWKLNPRYVPPFPPQWYETLKEAIRLAETFNRAAQRCGIPNSISLDEYSPFYKANHIERTLRTNAIAGSALAEVTRTLGSALATRFAELLAARAENLMPMPSTALPWIFICYSWADKNHGVHVLSRELLAAGYPIWFDEAERPDTASLDVTIESALLNARLVIVCLSAELLARSGYAARELVWLRSQLDARAARRRMMIANIDDTLLPPSLGDLPEFSWQKVKDHVGTLGLERWSTISTETLQPALHGEWTGPLLARCSSARVPTSPVISIERRRWRARLLRALASLMPLYEAREFRQIIELHAEFSRDETRPQELAHSPGVHPR